MRIKALKSMWVFVEVTSRAENFQVELQPKIHGDHVSVTVITDTILELTAWIGSLSLDRNLAVSF